MVKTESLYQAALNCILPPDYTISNNNNDKNNNNSEQYSLLLGGFETDLCLFRFGLSI